MRFQLLTLFTCFLLIGCSKKDTPVYVQCYPLMPSSHLITEETYYEGPDTTFKLRTVFIYNPVGQLIFKLSSQGGIPDTIEKYTYFPDKIVMNSVEYTLNAQGLAASIFTFKTWKYNFDGYLTEETGTYSGVSYTNLYNYTCYNVEQVIARQQTSLGLLTDTTFYMHYYDKTNTIGNENHGIFFFGRQNNTLLKSEIIHGDTVFSNTYVFDSMNRVLWEIQKNNEGSVTYRKFSYL